MCLQAQSDGLWLYERDHFANARLSATLALTQQPAMAVPFVEGLTNMSCPAARHCGMLDASNLHAQPVVLKTCMSLCWRYAIMMLAAWLVYLHWCSGRSHAAKQS